MGIKSILLSFGKRAGPRGQCRGPVAGTVAPEHRRRLAWRGVLGAASGAGGIGGVDYRAEKYAVMFLLPARHSVFSKVASRYGGGRRNETCQLRLGHSVLCAGDPEQGVDCDVAGGAGSVLVVERTALALAQCNLAPACRGAIGGSERVDGVGTKISFGGAGNGVVAKRSRTFCHCG